jgi:hypothetical protein
MPQRNKRAAVGRTQERRAPASTLDGWSHKEANKNGMLPRSYHPSTMNEYVFVGLVTIAIALFAMGVMDILAVAITALGNLL